MGTGEPFTTSFRYSTVFPTFRELRRTPDVGSDSTHCALAGGLLPLSSSADVSVKFRFLVVGVFFNRVSLGSRVGLSNPRDIKSSRFYC